MGECERPPEPAIAREIPGDRRAIVTHRVERPPVGTEDRLLNEVRVAPQRLLGCRRRDVPASDRLVAVRRHDRLPVGAEEHPARAPRGVTRCRSDPSRAEVDEFHAALDADRHREAVRAHGEGRREAVLDPPGPCLRAGLEIPQRQLAVLGRGEEEAIVRCERELGRRVPDTDVRADEGFRLDRATDRLQRGGVSDSDLSVNVAEVLASPGPTRTRSFDPSFVKATRPAVPSRAASASCACVRVSMRRTTWSPPTARVRPSGLKREAPVAGALPSSGQPFSLCA